MGIAMVDLRSRSLNCLKPVDVFENSCDLKQLLLLDLDLQCSLATILQPAPHLATANGNGGICFGWTSDVISKAEETWSTECLESWG